MLAIGVVTLLGAAGCGKKGPPRPPFTPAPARIDDLKVRRLGDDITIQFTIPTRNTDGTWPADLETVEVYSVTGVFENRFRQPLDVRDMVKYTTTVARIEVQPPPEPPEERETEDEDEAAPPPPPPQPDQPPDPRPKQGDVIVVTERFVPAMLTTFVPPGKPIEVTEVVPRPPIVLSPIAPDTPPLTRTYVALSRSRRNRVSPLSPRLSVPLVELPPTPPAPVLQVLEKSVRLTWTAPKGARVAIQAPPATTELAGRLRLPFRVPPPHTYNVYESSPPTPGRTAAMPQPINLQPLTTLTFEDSRVVAGVERCYEVRTVEVAGAVTLESAASPRACVTPRDIFPPAAPKNLAAVGGEGAINLIWDANTEPDLAGYIVLRTEVGGGALQPITPAPIRETTYRDTAVKPGTRYVYAVVAVDNAAPQNVSTESNRVEEIAR